jgi:hypothetical protein
VFAQESFSLVHSMNGGEPGGIVEHRPAITGAAGLGKSRLACALGQKACRETCLFSTHVFPGSSPIWRSPMAIRVTSDFRAPSPASNCSSLPIRDPKPARPEQGAGAPRNRRGPLRRRLNHLYQPGSSRLLARDDRNPDARRRDCRSCHPQCIASIWPETACENHVPS